MKEEFNLSDKIFESKDTGQELIWAEYVKEFIRLLKAACATTTFRYGKTEYITNEYSIGILIDKLAGDKLI